MTNELIIELVEAEDLQDSLSEYLMEHVLNTPEEIYMDLSALVTDWYDEQPTDEDIERVLALAEHTNDDYSTCKSNIENSNWLVLTDDEADEAWEESLDNYLDECVLPELPESVQYYFNRELWIVDVKMDGRGHSLSGYDGNEYDVTINSTTYYLYRNN